MLPQQKHEFMATNLPLSHGWDKNRQKGILHTGLKSDVHNSKLTDKPGRNTLLFLGSTYTMHTTLFPKINKPSERFKPLHCRDQGVLEGCDYCVGANPGPCE